MHDDVIGKIEIEEQMATINAKKKKESERLKEIENKKKKG